MRKTNRIWFFTKHIFLQSNITRPMKHLTAKPLLFFFAQSTCAVFKAAAGNTGAVSLPLGQPVSSSELSLWYQTSSSWKVISIWQYNIIWTHELLVMLTLLTHTMFQYLHINFAPLQKKFPLHCDSLVINQTGELLSLKVTWQLITEQKT